MQTSEVGASKEVIGHATSLNQRLYHPTRLTLRFSGYFLLIYIFYLNVGFLGLKVNIVQWMFAYLSYLLLLEFARWKRKESYDRNIFRWIRIIANIILTTWLFSIIPDYRHTLSLFYIIPILAATVYFIDSKRAVTYAHVTTVVCLFLGGILYAKPPSLSIAQYVMISTTIVMVGILLRKVYLVAIQDPINLAELGNRLHYIKNIEDLITEIADACTKLSKAEQTLIIITNPDQRRYITHYSRGIDLVEGKTMEDVAMHCTILETGQEYDTTDFMTEPFRDSSVYKMFFKNVPRSVLAEPIHSKDNKVLGVISVSNSTTNYFDWTSKNLIRQLSYIVSSAIENCLIYRQVQLGQVCDQDQSELLSKATNEEEGVSLLTQESLNFVPTAEGCTFHLYQTNSEELEPISYENKLAKWENQEGEATHIRSCDMQYGEGIAGKSLEIREPIRISRVGEHPWFKNTNHGSIINSLLVTPVIDPASRMAIGTISLCSSKESAFTVDDELILSRLACQGARQLANFRAFKRWREHGGEIKQIFEKLRSLDIEMSEELICNDIARYATTLLGFDLARIRLYDPQTDELETISLFGVSADIKKKIIGERMPFSVLEPYLSSKYRAGSSFLIPDNAPGWREVADKYFYIDPDSTKKQSGWKAYDAFLTPLVDHIGNKIGILSLDLPHSGKPNSQVVEKVDVYARAAAWVLERADVRRGLMEKQERTMAFIKSIRDVATGATDIIGLGEVIVQIGANLLSAEGCTLHLVRGDYIVLTHSNYLNGTKFINSKMPINLNHRCGLTSYVAATGKPVLHNNKSFIDDIYWAGEKSHLPYLLSKRCESLLKVPIINNEKKVLGVITLENKKRFGRIVDFDKEDLERLSTLASEVALAIDIVYGYEKILRWEHLSLKDDLHELVNWYHSGVYLYIESLFELLDKRKYSEATKQFPELKKRALTAVDEIKTLHTAITSQYLEEEHFPTALELLTNAWAERYNHLLEDDYQIKIQVDCDAKINLPVPLRTIFLRIASNAISNSLKHSGIVEDPGVQLKISINRIGNQVAMKIVDTGHGMEEKKRGFGFNRINQLVNNLNIQENIRTNWALQSSKGQGTKVEVTSYL